MIVSLRDLTSTPAVAPWADAVRDLGWQVFLAPADRGLLLGLETKASSDESVGDAVVERVRWLLPESEYGLQIVRAYAAPGSGIDRLCPHFAQAIAARLPRRGERLLLLIDGFDLLDGRERLAHLATFRLALRMPNVVVLLWSARFGERERRFFDRIDGDDTAPIPRKSAQ